MKPYYWKCRKDTKKMNPRVQILVILKQWYYQNMQYAAVKINIYQKLRSKRTIK